MGQRADPWDGEMRGIGGPIGLAGGGGGGLVDPQGTAQMEHMQYCCPSNSAVMFIYAAKIHIQCMWLIETEPI